MTQPGGLCEEELSFAEADRIVRAAVEAGKIPGVALQVRAGGRVVHERAFGRCRIDEDAALRVDDIFPIASLTKRVVAIGILRVCEGARSGSTTRSRSISPSSPSRRFSSATTSRPERCSLDPRGVSSPYGIC
jgi:Beta-lactamase